MHPDAIVLWLQVPQTNSNDLKWDTLCRTVLVCPPGRCAKFSKPIRQIEQPRSSRVPHVWTMLRDPTELSQNVFHLPVFMTFTHQKASSGIFRMELIDWDLRGSTEHVFTKTSCWKNARGVGVKSKPLLWTHREACESCFNLNRIALLSASSFMNIMVDQGARDTLERRQGLQKHGR